MANRILHVSRVSHGDDTRNTRDTWNPSLGGVSAGEPAVHDFDGMEGVDASAVENLLSA
jgi:hypothetical protein